MTDPPDGTDALRARRLARPYLVDGDPALTATLDLVASVLDFPWVQVNVFDDTTQHTISQHGLPDIHTMPRDETLCQLVLAAQATIVVPDATNDPRVADLPAVKAGQVRAYLGVPLRSRESEVIGTLCVLDPGPREIDATHIERLEQFAHVIEDQLDLIRRAGERPPAPPGASTVDVAAAIRAGEIVPWYQPVFDLRTDEAVGYEALARWQHPGGAIEDPARFVPLAEDSDLVVDLDRAVIGLALADLARWQVRRPQLRLGLNVSTRHLEIPGGVEWIVDTVAAAGVGADAIDLELTETRDLADEESARAAVDALRAAGFAVLLDDFGTGWSSVDWALRLAVSGIKVDRAVTALLGRPVGDAVTKAMVGLGAEAGLDLIIEGIATVEQVEAARALGCVRAQGFYWSPAIPAATVDRWGGVEQNTADGDGADGTGAA